MSLLHASKQYKPFEYPWAFEFWKRQQQLHWLPEEVPLGEDCRDWAQKLSDHERNLLTQIFRFFTQADVEVQDDAVRWMSVRNCAAAKGRVHPPGV